MPLTAFRDPVKVVCSFALVLTVVWGLKSGRKDYSHLWSPDDVWRGVKFSLVKKLFSRKQGWQTKSMKLKMSSAITNTAYEQTQSSQFTVKKHRKRTARMNIYEAFSKSSLDSLPSDMCMRNTEMIISPGCVKLSEAHRQTNNSNKNSNKDTNNSNGLYSGGIAGSVNKSPG